MIAGLVHRVVAVLRRGDVLPGAAPSSDDPGAPATDRRALAALTTRSSLREFTSSVPALREELINRARTAGMAVAVVAAVAVPAWTVVDRIAVPHLAGTFLAVRLLGDLPMLWVIWALWRLPIGRRRPEVLTFAVLALVQIEIAWMIAQTHGHEYYLLGFTLAVYGSGCILVARPRWTAAVVAVSWVSLAVSAITQPGRLTASQLVSISVFLGTASVIGMLAHLRRYALNNRELVTRVRLEREQQRTGVLLAQLER
ncbi:hypothetical protein E4P40_25655, partial [Blastococcus sp. CT_GayMR20]|uniref:hypothetical protein n=1 Tax=Blastococcus sp. CT_GayMR20 TaxID=2559609 RepID=UPI001101381E